MCPIVIVGSKIAVRLMLPEVTIKVISKLKCAVLRQYSSC